MNRAQLREQARQRLLGDRIAAGLQTVGADQVAKAYERVTGRPCGCAKRTARLNQWDAQRRS